MAPPTIGCVSTVLWGQECSTSVASSILFKTTRLRTQARPYRYTEAPTRRIRHDGAETAKWKTSAHEFYHRVAFLVALDDLMSDLTDRLDEDVHEPIGTSLVED